MELRIYSRTLPSPTIVLTNVKDYSIDGLGVHVLYHNGNRDFFPWNHRGEYPITRVKSVNK